MRKMTGKAKMLAAGMALGLGAAMLFTALAVSGRLGGLGILAVLLLIGLAGFGGWMMGLQMRIRLERERIWLEGYKDGRKETQVEIRAYYYRMSPFLERLGR